MTTTPEPAAPWALPDEPDISAWLEPAIPIPDEDLEVAHSWDQVLTSLLDTPTQIMQAAIRAHWLAAVGPRWCDCPHEPHHRWNCRMTPIWAQTIRDLDTNPWTVITRATEGWLR